MAKIDQQKPEKNHWTQLGTQINFIQIKTLQLYKETSPQWIIKKSSEVLQNVKKGRKLFSRPLLHIPSFWSDDQYLLSETGLIRSWWAIDP